MRTQFEIERSIIQSVRNYHMHRDTTNFTRLMKYDKELMKAQHADQDRMIEGAGGQ